MWLTTLAGRQVAARGSAVAVVDVVEAAARERTTRDLAEAERADVHVPG